MDRLVAGTLVFSKEREHRSLLTVQPEFTRGTTHPSLLAEKCVSESDVSTGPPCPSLGLFPCYEAERKRSAYGLVNREASDAVSAH